MTHMGMSKQLFELFEFGQSRITEIVTLRKENTSLQERIAQLEAAQQSVQADPPSACEDCGSVDEHIHYANCPLANTAGR